MPKRGDAWTAKEDEVIVSKATECIDDVCAILKAMGTERTADSVRNRRYILRHKVAKPEPQEVDNAPFLEQVGRVIHENKRTPKDLKWEDCLDGFSQTADFRKEFSIGYRFVKCRIETDRPIALVCLSDVHIGSPFTDYEAFRSDIGQIVKDDRLFMLKGGDWADKFMPSFRDKQAATGQIHPATIQLLTIEKIMEALDGRIVAALAGNHDSMDAKDTGISSEYWIHRGKDFPYLPNGGLVELTVGTQVYRILWFHNRMTGNSQLNIFNVFRWLRMLDATADIAILEHEHNPGIETKDIEDFDRKRSIVNIRTGTYKIGDPFSQKFFKDGRIGPQPVILYPDRRKIVPMHGADGIEDARTFLDGCAKSMRHK